jgi:cytochrome c553
VAASTTPTAGERFDEIVRNDFFDGLRGDAAALDRVLRFCEDTLARQPGHPEAMVWHGGATIARSVNAFRTGDRATGMTLYTRGLSEMDRAVELAPGAVGVRIPRGAVVLSMAPYVPEPEKSRLWQRGVADYEVALAAQAPRFSTLSQHAREQLLYGLLDGYAGLGDTAKAEAYYQRMTVDAAGSQLLGRAKARAAGEPVPGATPCQECHGR